MGKRNQQKEVHNYNIANVNMDIKYNKLVTAIVDANELIKKKEQEQKTDKDVKIKNLKDLFYLIFATGKFCKNKKTEGNIILLSCPLIFVYNVLAIIFAVLSFILLWFIGTNLMSCQLSLGYVINMFVFILIFALCVLLQATYRMAAKEISQITDIQTLATLFSSMMSFIAMIVAVASMFVTLKLGGVI